MRTCKSCGALYESINPFRKHCDNCQAGEQRRQELAAFHADPYDLAPLANVADERAASEMIARLEASDIPAVPGVHGRFIGDLLLDGMGSGQLQVLVRNSDYDRAMDLLGLDDLDEYDPRHSDLVVLLSTDDWVGHQGYMAELEKHGVPALMGSDGHIETGVPARGKQSVSDPQILVRARDLQAARELLGLEQEDEEEAGSYVVLLDLDNDLKAAASFIDALEEAGIPAVLGFDGYPSASNAIPDGLDYDELQVLVRDRDFDAACKVLNIEEVGPE